MSKEKNFIAVYDRVEKLEQACKEYRTTIRRMDEAAQLMDKNYGQMVLWRDRLAAEANMLRRIQKEDAFTNIKGTENYNRICTNVMKLQAENKRQKAKIERLTETLLRIDNYCRVNDIDIEEALKGDGNG